MTGFNLAKTITVTSLAMILSLSLSSGVLAKDSDSAQPAPVTKLETDNLDNGAVVTITRVDSKAFPQVTLYVTVTGEDGLPVNGLTVDDFQLLEDGIEVPTKPLEVEEDVSQSFSLVLALDTSMASESLVEIQEAAKSFIDTLEPQDQIAIISFSDDVQLVQDFTGDKETLYAALDSLGVAGDRTALYQAALESVEMAGRLPYGRRVVVVVTDSANDVRGFSAADVGKKSRELGVPVYAIGCGDEIRKTDIEDLARLTKGQAFHLSCPNGVGDPLQEIQALLRQGYKVVFESGQQADNAEHDFSVGIVFQDQLSTAQGRFLAVPGQVTVVLPGWADGQMVAGTVHFTPLITATAPGVAVDYVLDEQLLAQRDTPPYSLEWDSLAAQPGDHVLTIKAVDGLGNEGQISVTLSVPQPLEVTATVSQEEVELGNEVTIQAGVAPLAAAGTLTVEILLDDNQIGVGHVSPYNLAFDTSAYTTGAHVITVRANDDLGRASVASLNVLFVAPPQARTYPWDGWRAPWEEWTIDWALVLVSVIAGGILLAAAVALIHLLRWGKTRYRQIFQMEILNQGNTPSRYELRAVDPSGTLEFEFSLKGTSLQRRPIATTAFTESIAATPGGTMYPPREPTPDISASDQYVTTDLADNGTPGRIDSARKAAGAAAGVSGALAGMLSKASVYLPGSLGASAQRASAQLRRARVQTQRADRMADRATKTRDSVVPSKAAPEPPSRDQAPPIATSKVEAERSSSVQTWAQTPLVEPGDTLVVDLLVNPVRPFKTQHYLFQLYSRSVEQEGAPMVAEDASVHMVRPSLLRRLFPYLVVLGVIVITISLYVIFLSNAGILE